MRARLYHRALPSQGRHATTAGLEALRQAAEARGWEVAGEYSDAAQRGAAWPGRRQLKAEAQPGERVVVEHLHHLARSLEDLVDTLHHLIDRGVSVVALEGTRHSRPLDTTRITQHVALVDAVALLRGVRGDLLAEAAVNRQLRPLTAGTPGRPAVAVSPWELADLYHAGKSQREIVRTLERRGAKVSRTKVRQVLADLRTQGHLDDPRRQAAIQARGGLPKGGRRRPALRGD